MPATSAIPMLRHAFRTRADLIAYVRAELPAADDYVAETRGGRRAALARLAAVDPVRYARSRNALSGAVTRLSPYLRHGVLGLDEVRAAALRQVRVPQDADKLINELGWRDYFRRVYAAAGRGIGADLEPYKTGWARRDYAGELPPDLVQAQTGLACMDGFVRELYATGYLHNHARMWLAAYVVHWRRTAWQAGARWFLTHLLDGDPASNHLSWQWVASTFSHKPYIFNRENLERYTGGSYCQSCPLRRACPLDAPYEQLEERLFPRRGTPEDGSRSAVNSPAVQQLARVAMAVPSRVPPDDLARGGSSGRAVVWVHGDALRVEHPAFAAAPGAPAVYVWDDDLLTRRQFSLKRLVFLYETLAEMAQDYPPLAIARGDVAATVAAFAAAQGADTILTATSPSPRFAAVVGKLRRRFAVVVAAEPPFVIPKHPLDLRRFSRYWQAVQTQAMG